MLQHPVIGGDGFKGFAFREPFHLFSSRADERIGAAAERGEENFLMESAFAESVLREIKNAVQLRSERRAVDE